MTHLSVIAREIGVEVEDLRDLERAGHFACVDSDSEGYLYDIAEVRTAIARSNPTAPLLHFIRLLAMKDFFYGAKNWRMFQIRRAAADFVLKRGNTKETKASVARRLGISRKHFSITCRKFCEVTLLG